MTTNQHGERFKGGPRRGFVTAVITRADGRVEDLGVIAESHRNPIINAYLQAKLKVRAWWRKKES